MRRTARDRWEILKFDLVEDTAGSWLRGAIQRLEKRRDGGGADQRCSEQIGGNVRSKTTRKSRQPSARGVRPAV